MTVHVLVNVHRFALSRRLALRYIALPIFNLEGPGGDIRRSLTFSALAELLRRRFGIGAIGIRPEAPYGPGD